MKKIVFAALLIALLATLGIEGCPTAPTENEAKQLLIDECEAACHAAVAAGQELNNGPCLLDPMSNSEWVCDIAHEPRQPVDNEKENQCDAWHAGTATHFIEFTPDCSFIKAV